MITHIAEISMSRAARIAGFGYLIIFITGIFANFFVIEGLIVPGDASATAGNIAASQGLFRAGILSFIIMVIFDLIVAWALYELLIPVNRQLSLFTAWFRLVNGTVFGVALYHLLAVLQLVNGAGYLSVFRTGQIQAQIMLSLDAFNNTWLLGLVFFGIHLLFLGYLIFKSDYIPKIIGILLMIAGIGYLIDSFAHFLLSNYADYETLFTIIVVLPGIVGELSFTVWLLVKGRKLRSNH